MFILLVCVLIALYVLGKKSLSTTAELQKCGNKIPGPKPLPIIGNALQLGITSKSIFQCFKRLPKEHGPISRIWLGPKLGIVLCHPSTIELLLSSTKHLKKSFLYETMAYVAGRGLVASPVEVWRPHRKIIAPTFGAQQLLQSLDVFNSKLDVLVELLSKHQNGPSFDVQRIMTYFALDVICETSMGWKPNAMLDQHSEFIKFVNCLDDTVFRRMFQPWFYPDIIFKWSSPGRRQAFAIEVPKRIIRQRKEKISIAAKEKTTEYVEKEYGIKTNRTFLDQLLYRAEQKKDLDETDILHEVVTMLMAGHDTTANALSYTCWLLAKHQDVQAKVVEELRCVFGDSLRPATMQDVNELKYLEMVLKETLRIYPPIPVFARELTEDLVTDQYVFPAGSEVAVNVYMLHRHPEHFPDPERFDPDRFLPENCTKRHPYAYLPFSAGPRNCVGYKYAFIEMKVTMAKLLRHFKILPPENPFQDLDLAAQLVLKSQNGVHIRLQPRNI